MTEDEHAKVVPVNGNNHSESNQHRENDDDSESAEVRHKRSVRFGDGDQLITAVFEANSPWANEPLNPYELAGAYKLRCDVEGIVPLYSVLSQLESINLRYSYARRDVFTLKGTQLKAPHIELLEEVFKRVQFELINLENTNLTDETMSALCEMFEFYESCAELCLARNPQITGEGWKAVARLLRKLPCLRWLDVRGIPLNESDTQSLSHAIRSQAMCCRAEMSKFSKYQLANQRLAESVLTAGLTDEEQRTQVNKLACEMKRLATCQTHAAIKCQQCLSQIPYRGLRGLHLGSTKVRDIALSRLVTGIRLSSICDLRLPDNHLTPSDAVFLIPLLRFGATLRYLDLSRNRLGDEGLQGYR
ncbi:hypothetical protein FGIG_09332 [Fasciola gigantica]|uniref:Uncharacterized protein n=1 Tax=Fasciola gigantica TaxID=46835 RepID=A0A504YXR6_FASGI|nr:hypothetical protein FGIG_09332 [Fasciola gigantica]